MDHAAEPATERIVIIDDITRPEDRLGPPWHILLVDHHDDRRDLTSLVLASVVLDRRPIHLHFALSCTEAMALLQREGNRHLALALIDQELEDDGAGLRLAEHIRGILGNRTMRLVLRSPERGTPPDEMAMLRLDLSDIRPKPDLQPDVLVPLVLTTLRAHQHLVDLERMAGQVEALYRSRSQVLRSLDQEFRQTLDRLRQSSDELQRSAVEAQVPVTAVDAIQRGIGVLDDGLKELAGLRYFERSLLEEPGELIRPAELLVRITQRVPFVVLHPEHGILGRFRLPIEPVVVLTGLLARHLLASGTGPITLRASGDRRPIQRLILALGEPIAAAVSEPASERSIRLVLARVLAHHLGVELVVCPGSAVIRIAVSVV